MTIRTLRRHRKAIIDFHNAYVAYLEAGRGGAFELRARVIELIPAAQAAMIAAGITPVLYPPPAFGGLALSGLANLAFAHERPGFRMTPIAPTIIDWCMLTTAQLDERIQAVQRRRKNPLYWIDQALRALLGIPAYLVSLIFRVPFDRVDSSPVGSLLRALSAVGNLAAVYFGGREAGWW